MKKTLILHGTGATSQDNWFPWLKAELEEKGYYVWCPNLPHAEKPNIQKYNEFILSNKEFTLDTNTTLIGHSSGAVAILGLLDALDESTRVGDCYLVGAFKNDLGWEALDELFINEFDFKKIKTRAKKFTFIHSNNDPYCPLDHAQYLAEKLDAELIVKEGQGHFSAGKNPKYTKFPYLLELIKECK